MDDEVSASSVDGGSGNASEGFDTRDMWAARSGDHEGSCGEDHVHLFVSIPPQVTISRMIQWLKGKSSYKMLGEFPHLQKQFWGRHLWARGYFCCSSGNVSDEVIAEYIANQSHDRDDDFKVDG